MKKKFGAHKGFGRISPEKTQESKPHQSSSISYDHGEMEMKALLLVREGKLKEAESIYLELIQSNSNNHLVYGNLASIRAMQGRFDGIIKYLKKALEINPNYIEGHNNLGIALKKKGDINAAILSYKNALKLNPGNADFYNNLGISLQENGEISAAVDAFTKSISIKPNKPEGYIYLANSLTKKHAFDEAISNLNKALSLEPNNAEAYNNLGIALQKKGDNLAAIDAFNKALCINPRDSNTLNNIGLALKENGHSEEAMDFFKKAVSIDASNNQSYVNIGTTLMEGGSLEDSIIAFKESLKHSPCNAKTYNMLGIALTKLGKLEEAVASLKKSLTLDPNHPDTHNNLGIALQEKQEISAAMKSFKQAIQLDPNHPQAMNNIGLMLMAQGKLKEAIETFDKALEKYPNNPQSHWASGLCMLLAGDYKNGLEKYEWRTKVGKKLKPHANPKCKKWDGSFNSISNRKLLVVSEQGLGDTLQFMRYIVELRHLGKEVTLCAQAKLHGLIKASGIDSSPLTPEQANNVVAGEWVPLLSVPKHLHVDGRNPIIQTPYISTENDITAKWRNILSHENKPIIGINWQGNPRAEKTALKGRSLPLLEFSRLSEVRDVSFLSLQKGSGSEQLDTCSFKDRFVRCQDLIDEVWDFLETAAIIKNCSLIITSDTSVAHLAAGLGKTTWLLLHKVPDWRWGVSGNTTFWYPSIRIFRQKEYGDWSEVMDRVKSALRQHMSKNLYENVDQLPLDIQ